MISEKENKAIVSAIEIAETNCSGEIRVHFDKICKGDPIKRAVEVFRKLDMEKTELRNGVLFYFAMESHKFAILGDVGIDQKTPKRFWDDIKDAMLVHLKNNDLAKAAEIGISMAGHALAEHFPYQSDDINELSNHISFEE